MNLKKYLPYLKNTLLVIAGTLILSLGVSLFVIPFNLTVGGSSTLAIIINRITGIHIEYLITVITWTLFLVGLIFLGKNFAFKTLVSSLFYPLGITIFSRLLNENFLGGFFNIANSNYSEISIILATVFGGVLIGTGCSLAYTGGGSTGGTDIIAFLICKISKKFNSSTAIFFVDSVLIFLGAFAVKDLALTLLGITTAFITALVIDKLYIGESKALIAQIISNNYLEINNLIAQKLQRTTSIIEIKGGYTGQKKYMLFVTFTINQYNELLNIINNSDKNAFVTIHRAHEINGEGW